MTPEEAYKNCISAYGSCLKCKYYKTEFDDEIRRCKVKIMNDLLIKFGYPKMFEVIKKIHDEFK